MVDNECYPSGSDVCRSPELQQAVGGHRRVVPLKVKMASGTYHSPWGGPTGSNFASGYLSIRLSRDDCRAWIARRNAIGTPR